MVELPPEAKLFDFFSFLWKSQICYCVRMKIILYLLKPVSLFLYFNYLTRWCSLSETKKETKHKKKPKKKPNNTKENSFFQTLLNRPHLSLTLKKKSLHEPNSCQRKANSFCMKETLGFFFLTYSNIFAIVA